MKKQSTERTSRHGYVILPILPSLLALSGCLGVPMPPEGGSTDGTSTTSGTAESTTESSGTDTDTDTDAETDWTATETAGNGVTVGPPISSSICGNGIVEADEQCEPGGSDSSGDYNKCSDDCVFEGAHCGDGTLDVDYEQCDHGGSPGEPSVSGTEYGVCLANCQYEASYCGDGTFDSDYEECDPGEGASNPVADAYCSDACRGPNWVFITSTTHKGNFDPDPNVEGGISAAIEICNYNAKAGDLPGEYRPWLATDNFEDCPSCSPATAFETHSDVPYEVREMVEDGDDVYTAYRIADNWEDLTSANGEGQFLKNAIGHTEFGLEPASGVPAWTGVDPQGKGVFDPNHTCGGWLVTTGKGVVGESSQTDLTWTHAAEMNCSVERPIYCFRQSVE